MSKDGGSAFPLHITAVKDSWPAETKYGMTLRDYFAAMAMAALFDSDAGHGMAETEMIAVEAYEMADAMLRVRKE